MRTCKLFCVLAALLAVFSLSASAMTAEAQAKAELEASRFSEYIDQFYPDGRTGPHAETIAMITRGLQRQEVTLGSLVQIAETISSTAHSGLATEIEAELDMEESVDADAEAEEEADVDAETDADAEEEGEADVEEEETTEAETEAEAAAEEPVRGASLLAAQQSAMATAAVTTAATVSDGGAGTGVDAASPSGGTMRGPNGCLLHNGVECNGERAGKCMGSVCHCIAGWTGLRCQVEWSLARLNPYTGLAEGTAECASVVAQYLSSCN